MNQLSKPKIILYLTGIFLAGVVTGAVLMVAIGKHLMPNQSRMAQHWTHELQTKLTLAPEQVQKIEPIIIETLAAFKTVMANDALTSLSNCNARIAAELKPEQMDRFRQLEQEQQEFIRRSFCAQTNCPKPNP
jgi:multidrug efflux pump subunit AcrB